MRFEKKSYERRIIENKAKFFFILPMLTSELEKDLEYGMRRWTLNYEYNSYICDLYQDHQRH